MVGFWHRFSRWLGLPAQGRSTATRPCPPETSMTLIAPPEPPQTAPVPSPAEPKSDVGNTLAMLTQRYQAALLSNPPRSLATPRG